MSSAPVENNEILHRSVPCDAVVWTPDGWHLTSEAFNDRGMAPSVDRRAIRPLAEESKLSPTDGIAQLLAAEVRECDQVVHNPDVPAPEQVRYKLDVEPDPIREGNAEGRVPNLSHALIKSAPTVASKSRFKKIKEALCRLARRREWVIRPHR
jgi:hypothetical protein